MVAIGKAKIWCGLLGFLCVLCLMAGCGQKGPLKLPNEPQQPIPTPQPDAL